MDTFVSSKKSGSSERGYTSVKCLRLILGMYSKYQWKERAESLFKEIGVTLHLIFNQAQEQVLGDAIILCNKEG